MIEFCLMKCEQVQKVHGDTLVLLYGTETFSSHGTWMNFQWILSAGYSGEILTTDRQCSPVQYHQPRRAHMGYCIRFEELRGSGLVKPGKGVLRTYPGCLWGGYLVPHQCTCNLHQPNLLRWSSPYTDKKSTFLPFSSLQLTSRNSFSRWCDL